MERDLNVLEKGLLFARLVFSYDSQTSGKVDITYYKSDWLTDAETGLPIDGLQTSVPILLISKQTVHHDPITTMNQLYAYDRGLLEQQDPECPSMRDDYTLFYQHSKRRYMVTSPVYGIVDVNANFDTNVKIIDFISAINQADNTTYTTDCLQTDATVIEEIRKLQEKGK